jgi:hypothetical protein
MLTLSALLGVALIAYRVFVKGESIIVKTQIGKCAGLRASLWVCHWPRSPRLS